MDYTYTYSHNYLHDMHSLVKFIILLLYLPLISRYNHPLYLFIISINLGTLAYCGGVLKRTLKMTKYTLIAGVIIAIINTLLSPQGATALLSFSIQKPFPLWIYISWETILYSLIMVYRLILIMIVFSLVNMLIDPDKLLKALVKLRLPPQILYVVVLSIRFIPVLMEDLGRIQDLQRARGLDLDKGTFFVKIKKKVSLLLPLLTNSLERAIQISEALESRAFGLSNKRTYFKFERANTIEVLNTIIMGLTTIAALIFISLYQSGEIIIYPTVILPPLNIWDAINAIILLGSTGCLIILTKRRWKKNH